MAPLPLLRHSKTFTGIPQLRLSVAIRNAILESEHDWGQELVIFQPEASAPPPKTGAICPERTQTILPTIRVPGFLIELVRLISTGTWPCSAMAATMTATAPHPQQKLDPSAKTRTTILTR